MRLAIVHHHLHPGGVTRIIEHAVTALRGCKLELVILSGQAPQRVWGVPLRVSATFVYLFVLNRIRKRHQIVDE